LIRVHLLDEDEFRYVIAYSQFKTGLYSAAEKSLQRITDVKMFRKATQLRKVMTSCADEKWMC
jgi:hypothetical protein